MLNLLLIGVLVFDWLAWVIFLGGVGASQDFCSNCTATFAFEWWILWFQFVVLLAATVVAVMPGQAPLKRVVVIMFAMVTSILMVSANSVYQTLEPPFGGPGGSERSRLAALFAGQIMTLVCNFVYLILTPFISDVEGGSPAGGKDVEAPHPTTAQPAPQYTGAVPTAPVFPTAVPASPPAAA